MEKTSEDRLIIKYVCHGCLSKDRTLYPHQDSDGLISYLCHSQIGDPNGSLNLCWECVALLRSVRRFQERIQQAQATLRQSLCESGSSTFYCLSNLSCSRTNNLEVYVNRDDETYRVNELVKPPTVITCDVKTSDIKEEVSELNIDVFPQIKAINNFNEDTHYDDSTTDFEIKEELLNKKFKEQKPVKNTRKKFSKHSTKARITINTDINLSDVTKYYTVVQKSEKEMEEMLEKERKRRDYKKLRYSCKSCKIGFGMAVNFKRHNTFVHMKQTEGPFKCLECGTVTDTRVELLSHWGTHSTALRCTVCGLEHHVPGSMRKHIATHGKIYTCTECYVNFWSLKDFSEHYKSLHKKLICDHCGQTFLHKRSIMKHLRRHHMSLSCRECGRQYTNYHGLSRHYRMIHPELVYKTIKSESSYCVECNKQYPSEYKYRRHLATAACHTPPKRVRVNCPECGKVFARKTYMNNHYRLVHSNSSKHHCQLCDKYFTNASSMKKHKLGVHDKVQQPKDKICDVCGRGFTVRRVLIHHMRTHTGERPHACARCPAAFAQRVALLAHVRARHARDD